MYVRACLVNDVSVIADVICPHGSRSSSLALFVHINKHEGEKATILLDGLAENLSDVLLGFMIPSVYIPIDEIPLAATGKADRRRLREMGSAQSWEELNAISIRVPFSRKRSTVSLYSLSTYCGSYARKSADNRISATAPFAASKT